MSISAKGAVALRCGSPVLVGFDIVIVGIEGGSAGAAPAASVFGPNIFIILTLMSRTVDAA